MYNFKEEEKKQMMDEIACFFKEEQDLDLGIIGTERIYDFFMDMLGDRIYNMALDDAARFAKQYANNAETDYYAMYKEIR